MAEEIDNRGRDVPVAFRGPEESGEDAASTEYVWFDRKQPIGFVAGSLPHLRQEGVTYFVTWRTADSMPRQRVEQWVEEREVWLARHPEPHDLQARAEYDRLFRARWEQWLDESHGECLLARPDIRTLVEGALGHFDGKRYRPDEFVVAPNHVHVLATPLDECDLSKIEQNWKSFTAHEINKTLARKGTFWEKESFYHIVRSPQELERIQQYIRGHVRSITHDVCGRDVPVAFLEPRESGEDAASTDCCGRDVPVAFRGPQESGEDAAST